MQMIRTGEETGNLDAAFHNLAEYYEGELERAIRQLEGVMRPLSILAMGGLVALLCIRAIASLINSLPG
jgi:type IV pilus assembly protein PilC